MSETDGLLSSFENVPTILVLENRTSEPRDALLSERTTLSWIRFAGTLVLTSVAIMLNYRFDTSEDGNSDAGFTRTPLYIITTGVVFATLAISSIILGGYNYFQTVDHCISQKIKIFNPAPTLIVLTITVLVLLGVSITLIVDQF